MNPMYRRTDDPVADFMHHDAEQARELEKLPVCADCGEPITDDHFYEINGEYICPNCLDAGYRKNTEDYIE